MTRFRVALAAFIIVVLAAAIVSTQRQGNLTQEARADVATTAPQAAPQTLPAPTTTNAPPEPTSTTTAAPVVETTTTTVYVPPTTQRPVVTAPPTTRAPAPAPPTTVQPAPVVRSGDDVFLNCVMMRESKGNPSVVNPSSGAGGLFQFMRSTWAAMGFTRRYGVAGAEMASAAQQWEAARITLAQVGRSPWAGPGC